MIKFSILILLITLGCVGIATAGAIPVDPGNGYVPTVVTTGSYYPVIVSAVDPGLFHSPIVQPSFISDLSPQWFQTPALAQEPTRELSPIPPADIGSIPVAIQPFNPVQPPLPALTPSIRDTSGLFPLASDIEDQVQAIITPVYDSETFSPLIWGGAFVGPMTITGDRGTTNWMISVAFDRSVTIEEAYNIVEKHQIPDGYRIIIPVTPRNHPPESVTFWIDYNCEQPDSVAKTVVDRLRYDPKITYINVQYGVWA